MGPDSELAGCASTCYPKAACYLVLVPGAHAILKNKEFSMLGLI
jgi:hypothetical protein